MSNLDTITTLCWFLFLLSKSELLTSVTHSNTNHEIL